MIEVAKYYKSLGFSVVPIFNKKPPVPWKHYQTASPTDQLIEKWFNENPNWGLGVVTGEVSGLLVVDTDTPEADREIQKLMGNMIVPTVVSPSGGRHYWFKQFSGAANIQGVIEGADIRAQGGVITVPPTKNEKGSYRWIKGKTIQDLQLSPVPNKLKEVIIQHKKEFASGRIAMTGNLVPLIIEHGKRDETLFSIGNALLKGGMPISATERVLAGISQRMCTQPYPLQDVPKKIASVLQRIYSYNSQWVSRMREYIKKDLRAGVYSTGQIYSDFKAVSASEKEAIRSALNKLIDEENPIIEKYNRGKGGEWRIVEELYTFEDWIEANDSAVPLKLPFGLNTYMDVFESDIVLVAGATNAAKTAICLNIMENNDSKFECIYWSSEIRAGVFKRRLLKHPTRDICDWNVKFSDDFGDIADVVKPNSLNVVDYIESDDPMLIKSIIRRIHEKLDKGLAVICVQKAPNKADGYGGAHIADKSSLYLTLDESRDGTCVCTVKKCKNYTNENINGWKIKYSVEDGIVLHQHDHIMPPDDEDKEKSPW